jgi:hypothetical protein
MKRSGLLKIDNNYLLIFLSAGIIYIRITDIFLAKRPKSSLLRVFQFSLTCFPHSKISIFPYFTGPLKDQYLHVYSNEQVVPAQIEFMVGKSLCGGIFI